MRYLRISQVSSFFKGPDYMEYLDKSDKRQRNLNIKKAMKIGTRVDELIKTQRKPLAKDIPEVYAAHNSFLSWKHNYPHFHLDNGYRMFNDKIGITGEPDLYINSTEISDIKCSLEIRLEYWIQLGGYLLLPNPYPIDKVSILRLDKSGSQYEYVCKEGKDLEDCKMLFLGELNKVRAYINHRKEEEKYGNTHLYYDRVAGASNDEVGT